MKRSAQKALAELPTKIKKTIIGKIDQLADDPRPDWADPLTGDPRGRWKFRVGLYRVVYSIDNDVLTVLVVRIGHRSDVYKNL